ncbi:MAG TPA: hypothetical protein VD993_03530 [Chitinophagaceae bacterium]|nr:hypothetical protein [Chitinophagaceae bacterium]
MNIEQIKKEWQQFEQRLTLSQRLNEQLIMSMLKERSRSRVSKIRRDSSLYLLLMVINLGLITSIFIGNPFDFVYVFQYIPFGLLALGVVLAIISLVKTMRRFNVNLSNVSLDDFLKETILGYEKNKKIEGWFGLSMFCAGLLTVFSFLPKKLENKDLWTALGETAISLTITLVIYFIAFKAGAFKNKKREAFEQDLKELRELKAISSDLNSN